MTEFWHVYLLKCADNTLYCGITTNPLRRLREHNSLRRGARYTRARRPVQLLATCCCESRSSALKLEALIKNLPRDRKLAALVNLAKQNAVA